MRPCVTVTPSVARPLARKPDYTHKLVQLKECVYIMFKGAVSHADTLTQVLYT